MKLFINTAGLCIIPKLVNAVEVQLTKLMTPDIPSTAELELKAKIAAENLIAAQLQANNRQFDLLHDQDMAHNQIEAAHIPGRRDVYDDRGGIIDIEPTVHTGPLDLPPGHYAPEVNDEGVIIPQANKLGIAQGNGSTVNESDMGGAYNQATKEKEKEELDIPPVKRRATFTKNMAPITKEVHDTINAFSIEMMKRNKESGKINGAFPFNKNDAARATNNYYGTDWGISTLTKCLRGPECITRIKRDDCPSHEEVYGTPLKVIRSVSQFSDMDKLNIKT